ncbi:hypothetical protein FF100_25610 [Methylobacterium terricola]|uniref:Uncharacterized protein n=1 Tax=Methylobacterium terricola TaxID=2583531 RepID=A0A5C4LAD0_9HYPH|nr:hypothetical protein [Methylobacterium terricola]TNC09594.1 hypothetical protein FF100_25610 [Methylobacterium terricola]
MRVLALPLLVSLAAGALIDGASAQGSPTPAAPSLQPGGAAAYPGSPGGQPAAERNGRSVATDHAACPGPGPCPAAPGPSGAVDTSRTAAPSSSVGQAGPVPSTAYPDAPGGMPSNRPDGAAPR